MKSFFKKIIVPIITWQAMHILGRFNPQIVAVTGSVGKTSTKEAIYHLLSQEFQVRKSEKSFNSEIGVPLAILGLPNAWSNPVKWTWNMARGFLIAFFSRDYPEILILEIGADKPGDIDDITGWVKPDISVVTALADIPVHVENFSSPEAVYEEKSKLAEVLDRDGVAVLNADDRRVLNMRGLTQARIVTFGIEPGAEVTAEMISHNGIQNIYPLLAAAAVAKVFGLSPEKIKQLSGTFQTPAGRMNVLPGINGSTIIDDSYNSSPVAAESALKTLKNMQASGRKIAALGDMRELGRYAESEHRRIGELVAGFANLLITVGPLSHYTALAAEEAGMKKENITEFLDSREAGKFLKNKIEKGDVILAKGSQNTIRMEWLVEEIISDPEHNKKFLVRQDKEWKNH